MRQGLGSTNSLRFRMVRQLVAVASSIAAIFLAPEPVKAAIVIDSSSKVVILYGYSPDLIKQEITTVHPLLNVLLPPLAADLTSALGAPTSYFTDSILNPQLAKEGLISEERTKAVTELLTRREHYTHLITAEITVINQEKGIGIASIQVKTLPDAGTPIEVDLMQGVKLDASLGNNDIDALRKGLVAEFVRKFRKKDVEKTIFFGCINPEIPRAKNANRDEKNRQELEWMLSPMVTIKLNALHNTQRLMKGRYRLVKYETFHIDNEGNCNTLDSSNADIKAGTFDYKISGFLVVRYFESGKELVDIHIYVVGELPEHCMKDIPVTEEFKPSVYDDKRRFSINFSDAILPLKYEPKWNGLDAQPCQ